MYDVRNLAARCFSSEGPVLHIGGISVTRLAGRYGTPIFVYDRGALDSRLNALTKTLPDFEIYYSVKANPNIAILRHFVVNGCGLEIASAGEFMQAIAAGCPAERIIFAGPAKTEKELELAINGNVGEIHIESALQASRIASLWINTGIRARVGIRINPTGEIQAGAMKMGGKPSPFGIDEENIDSVIDVLTTRPCFDFRGIHIFAGTQILDSAVLVEQYRKTIQLARGIVSKIGRPLQTIDFGGGFGIPYFPGDREFDLEHFGTDISNLMNEIRHDPDFHGTRLIIEPGRFLVGEAGIYISRIVDIKESRGKKFLILDGGMNHHLAASGNLGQTIKRNYPVALLEKLDSELEETVDVVGPLCTPLDTLARSLHLPTAEVGDLVGVFQSGAYARTASPLEFLSRYAPAEIWVDGGKEYLIRDHGSAENFIRNVHIPPPLRVAAIKRG